MNARAVLGATILCLFPFVAISAQTANIDYSVSMRNPVSHIYDVEMEVSGIRSGSIDVAMPAWSPGVLAIENFARNVQQFSAATRQNKSLAAERIDKQTWRVTKAVGEDVRVRYRVFSLGLTDEMADLTPAAVFMYVVGNTQSPVTVRFNAENGWKVYTALEKRGDRYLAQSYDELATSPAFAGDFKVVDLKSKAGVPVTVVFSNPRIQMTELQVQADVEDIANAAAAMFGKVPYANYLFLVKVQPSPLTLPVAYKTSSRLTVSENDFVTVSSYNTFLSGVALSFVQAWNGNVLRPQSMSPFDLSKESYSRLFWFTRGVSAYLADLLLLRAGIMQPAEYFPIVSSEINALQQQPGRLLMSLQDASWNAWVRADNAANSGISYILKGKIAGLLLDAELRARTSGKSSIETLFRQLIEGSRVRPLSEDAFVEEISEAGGVDVRGFFQAVVQGKGELEYNRYLEPVGLKVSSVKNPPTPTVGIEFERTETGQARIRRILPGSPAEAAKLDAGDLILAMDSDRVVFDNLVGRIHSKKVGKAVVFAVMRGDRLLQLNLTPVLSQTEVWSIAESIDAKPDQIGLREAMLATTR